MAKLTNTGSWEPATVSRRLELLRYYADHHLELGVRFGPNALISEPLLVADRLTSPTRRTVIDQTASRFLLRAAEISFVTGDTKAGLDLLVQSYRRLIPDTPSANRFRYAGGFQELAEAALLGVLLGRGTLSITADAIQFSSAQWMAVANLPSATNPEELALWLPLLLILASERPDDGSSAEFLRVSSEQSNLAAALNASSVSPLFTVLGLVPSIYNDRERVGFDLNRRDGYASLRQLEREYTQRIRLVASDQFHWNHLRFRTPIVDWGLVASQTLLVRLGARKPRVYDTERLVSPADFSWALGTLFARQRGS